MYLKMQALNSPLHKCTRHLRLRVVAGFAAAVVSGDSSSLSVVNPALGVLDSVFKNTLM